MIEATACASPFHQPRPDATRQRKKTKQDGPTTAPGGSHPLASSSSAARVHSPLPPHLRPVSPLSPPPFARHVAAAVADVGGAAVPAGRARRRGRLGAQEEPGPPLRTGGSAEAGARRRVQGVSRSHLARGRQADQGLRHGRL